MDVVHSYVKLDSALKRMDDQNEPLISRGSYMGWRVLA